VQARGALKLRLIIGPGLSRKAGPRRWRALAATAAVGSERRADAVLVGWERGAAAVAVVARIGWRMRCRSGGARTIRLLAVNHALHEEALERAVVAHAAG